MTVYDDAACHSCEVERCYHLRTTSALQHLADGPLLVLTSFLSAPCLAAVDVSCQWLKEHNAPAWQSLGSEAFNGIELESDGIYKSWLRWCSSTSASKLRFSSRGSCFAHFMRELTTLRTMKFVGHELLGVQKDEALANFRFRIAPENVYNTSIYMELEVLNASESLSLAIVDGEDVGCTSVAFSPDLGMVVHETWIEDTPPRLQGAYLQPMLATTEGLGFTGSVGVYISEGNLVFFRKLCRHGGKIDSLEGWETTSMLTGLAWSKDCYLTPCLAFGVAGSYHVRVTSVRRMPPISPERIARVRGPHQGGWISLD